MIEASILLHQSGDPGFAQSDELVNCLVMITDSLAQLLNESELDIDGAPPSKPADGVEPGKM